MMSQSKTKAQNGAPNESVDDIYFTFNSFRAIK